MIKFDTLNTKVIQNSVTQANLPVINPVAQTVSDNLEEKLTQKEKETKNNAAKIFLGATALAGTAIAGIMIYRGLIGNTNKSSVIPINYQEQELKLLKFLKENELLRYDAEKSVRTKIIDLFKKAMVAKPDSDEFKNMIERIVKVTGNEEQTTFKFINKIFSKEEANAVASFQRKYQYNYLLRASKINPADVEEIKILDKIISDSSPLIEDAVVYRGVRTKKMWDDFGVLDFAKHIKNGEVIEDKAFVSTSKIYGNQLAQVDPSMLNDIPDVGYIMRIKLPKGTKGIDCRAYSGKDSANGVNAEFILPRDSKFKILKIDEDTKIVDCEYILP